MYDRVSAVLLEDALHSNFAEKYSRTVDMDRIAPCLGKIVRPGKAGPEGMSDAMIS